MMTTFSIVTVCHNNAAALVATGRSVFEQTFGSLQYVVQDRGSSDATADVVKTFGDWIDDFRTEPDAGVYQGMNRALVRCRGLVTIFLNPGDRFASNSVLEQVAKLLVDEDDIVSGKALVASGGDLLRPQDDASYWAGSAAAFPATFIRTSLARDVRFDEGLTTAGELDFLSRARLREARFRMLDLAVCRTPGGTSSPHAYRAGFTERHQVLMKHFGASHPVDATLRDELAREIGERFGASHRLEAMKAMNVADLLREWDRLDALTRNPLAAR